MSGRPKPSPEVAQRVLHAAFPAWDASVLRERAELGYDPAWRPARLDAWDGSVVGLNGRPVPVDMSREAVEGERSVEWGGRQVPVIPFWEWQMGPGRDLDRRTAEVVFGELGFPDLSGTGISMLLGFARYWRACFLSPYTSDRLDLVTDWDLGPDSADSARLVRVYPPASAGLAVSGSIRLVHDDRGRDGLEGTGDPRWTYTVTISGPAEWITPATLADASQRALKLVKDRPGVTVERHPALTARQSASAAVALRRRSEQRWARAAELQAEGLTRKVIGERMAEEDGLPAPYPVSTVKEWLRAAKRGRKPST